MVTNIAVSPQPRARAHGVATLPLLDRKQVGTIRHIGNLARQMKGDWSNMMGPTDLNDGFGAYRYQLAYGYLAMALAHLYRLPAAPGVFRETFERMIAKMLEPDCWWYWHDASTGGGLPGTPISAGAVDPIAKDNIMYSAYLQNMTLLYNLLFDDDRYAQPEALTFRYLTTFFGPSEGYTFKYDQNALNDRIYWQMVENGFLGVACEPYCVFQICNQVPIMGFRLQDGLKGTSTADAVVTGYQRAWAEFGGLVDEKGMFNTFVNQHSNQLIPGISASMDAWCGTMMHSWNVEFVDKQYHANREKWLHRHGDGTISVKSEAYAGGFSQGSASPVFGWAAAYAREVGDDATADAMLAYADKHMASSWRDGGYTFRREDRLLDDQGNLILSSPMQANAILPLARLSVPHGLNKLFHEQWDRNRYSLPALTEVDFSIDLYRAVFVEEDRSLYFDAALWNPAQRGSVVISRLPPGTPWSLSRNGRTLARGAGETVTGNVEGVTSAAGKGIRVEIGHEAVAGYVLVLEPPPARN